MSNDSLMIDLRVSELLASRLCHDLVGPIGAVSNGMELMADDEFGMADDALALASKSATQAANLLQYFRLAYGSAGGRQGSDLNVFRDLAQGMLQHVKCELRWSNPAPGDTVPEACGKILLNVIALAQESLPRGGTVATQLGQGPDGFQITVKAQGTDAALREKTEEAMVPNVNPEELTPRNVHGHFTLLLVQRAGGRMTHEQDGPDSVTFTVVVP